jgi:hypothetical protein
LTLPQSVTITWTPDGLLIVPAVPPAVGVKAARIADMLEKFGCNTFSSTSATANMWGAWPADYSKESVIAGLNFFTQGTGLTMQVREYHYAGRRSWQEPWCQAVHAATGAPFSVAIGAGGSAADATSIVAMAAASAASANPWLRQVEGINEPNNDFGSGSVPQATVLDAQHILATAPASVLVAGPSVVFGLPYPGGYITPAYLSAAQMTDIKSSSAVANAHLYPPDQVDQDDGSGRGGIMRDTVAGMKAAYGTRPITITEWHPTLYGSHGHNLDPAYDAYYAACFMLSAFREGIDSYFWFALLDFGTAYLSGLFPQKGGVAPRPVANTIRALFQLTGDLGATKRTFTTSSLDFTVGGGTVVPNLPNAGTQSMLFQNSAGTFFLFVWNAQATPEGPTTAITVRFAKPMTRIEDFKISGIAPMVAVQTLNSATVAVIPLNGSVHLLRITV